MSSNKQYIKVLTNDLLHRGYQWKVGLNEIDVFNSSNECTSNALYICEIKDFFKWMTLYDNNKWVAYVTIPEDAQIVIMENKIKTNKVILHEPLMSLVEFIDIAVKNDIQYHTAFCWACENNYLDVVECLIKNGANIHAQNDEALRYASENGHLAVVKLLIYNGCDIHANDEYALIGASVNGHLEIVEYLISNGADIHAQNDWALRWASEYGHKDVVKYLNNHIKNEEIEELQKQLLDIQNKLNVLMKTQ